MYYLWVGTTVGSADVINSGGTQSTSYPATDLPRGTTLFAWMWTKTDGVWYHDDTTTFTVTSAPPPVTRSVFVYPTNGMTDVNLSQAFQWTTVPDAEAYYLYVGTTPGTHDLVDTGEIQQTSYTAASLPAGTTLYGRIWTQYAGQWSYSDISFSGTNPATFTFPTNGSSSVDVSQPFQWTPVSGAQAYYLYVGTSVGLKDLVDTGEIQQTSYAAPTLPANQTLYARIWTELGGVWLHSDITFSAAARATLTFPANGAVSADLSNPIQWTAVPGAQAYYLYDGTAVGLHNLVDTGEIQPTSYLASGIPANQTVYARMWTETGGVWRYADSTFSGFTKSSFVYPPNGAANVDVNIPIQWTVAPRRMCCMWGRRRAPRIWSRRMNSSRRPTRPRICRRGSCCMPASGRRLAGAGTTPRYRSPACPASRRWSLP